MVEHKRVRKMPRGPPDDPRRTEGAVAPPPGPAEPSSAFVVEEHSPPRQPPRLPPPPPPKPRAYLPIPPPPPPRRARLPEVVAITPVTPADAPQVSASQVQTLTQLVPVYVGPGNDGRVEIGLPGGPLSYDGTKFFRADGKETPAPEGVDPRILATALEHARYLQALQRVIPQKGLGDLADKLTQAEVAAARGLVLGRDLPKAEARVAAAMQLPTPEQIGEYATSLAALVTNYERLEAQRLRLEEALSGVSALTGPLQARADRVVSNVGHAEDDMMQLQGSIDTLKESFTARARALEELASGTDALQRVYAEKLQAVQAINAQELATQVAEREGQIKTLAQTVNGLVETAGRLGGNIKAVAEMGDAIAALGQKVEVAKSTLANYVELGMQVRERYNTFKDALWRAEQELAGFRSSVSSKGQEVTGAYGEFRGSIEALTKQATSLAPLLDRAKELEQRLAEAETVARGLPDMTELRRRYELVQATLQEGQALGDLLAAYKEQFGRWQAEGQRAYDGVAGRLKVLDEGVAAQQAALGERGATIGKLGTSVAGQEAVLAQLGERLSRAQEILARAEAAQELIE